VKSAENGSPPFATDFYLEDSVRLKRRLAYVMAFNALHLIRTAIYIKDSCCSLKTLSSVFKFLIQH
jgi:hypothetical protein